MQHLISLQHGAGSASGPAATGVSRAQGNALRCPQRQREQSTATSRAAQISRIRASASLPRRLTRTPTETLSSESRLTAERRGTGSVSGSRMTSLARPRIVVVHGATSVRRNRGMAASRDMTTTGRRPISANSHHQTSPWAGSPLTTRRLHAARTPGRPTRRARQGRACRMRRNFHPLRLTGDEQAGPRGPRRRGLRPSVQNAPDERSPRDSRRPWCSTVCGSCHKYATAA